MKGKKNAYICGRLHITVTVDRDEGTTPMFMGCFHCGKEGRMDTLANATSKMYAIDQGITATHEWYRPTTAELESLKGSMTAGTYAATQQHVAKGGLLVRLIETGG